MNRNLATVALIAPLVALPTAAWGEIANPSFENGWGGWTDVDPNGDATAISGHFNTGAHSAKITGETGRFEQTVPVTPNTSTTSSPLTSVRAVEAACTLILS